MTEELRNRQTPSGLPEHIVERDWRLMTVAVFLFGLGFAIYGGVFQNFLKDVLHAKPLTLGALESLREVPGLLTAFTGASLAFLAEKKVAAVGVIVCGAGVIATGYMNHFLPLLAVTVVWSVGFHLYQSVQPAITLSLSKAMHAGRNLGKVGGVGALATLLALSSAYTLSRCEPHLSYTIYFVVGGIAILAAAVLYLCLTSHLDAPPRQPLVIRSEYKLYYWLIFLEGCRRQLFTTFASFALILVYHIGLEKMLVLQFINAAMIWTTAPRIGKIVDKHGERWPLVTYSACLIAVFLGYASVPHVGFLMGLYLFDNVLFSFSVGYTTYLRRIVRPGELTPCLAMGTTMNHVAAVIVPFFGALLWQHMGSYQAPFWVGVGIACVSLYTNLHLPHGRVADRSDLLHAA
jgi:hypothetical protein